MLRQLSMLIFVPILVAAAFSFSPLANASAQRTFVASYGSATNVSFNCSLTKPCRKFSEAIGVTNPTGEVVVLDAAGYGPVTVTRSVSIIAPPGIYAGISVLAGDGVTVNAGASDVVVLRGLSITGQGGATGINLVQAGKLRIENCVVSNMGAVGIAHSAANAQLNVLDTVVRDNSGGFFVHADRGSAQLDHVRVEGNSGDGLYIAPPPGSVGVRAVISDSVFANNGGNAVDAEAVGGAETLVEVERSVLSRMDLMNFAGFRAFVGGAPDAFVNAKLSRNVLDSVSVSATLPGIANVTLVENSATLVINLAGGGVFADVSANTGLIHCTSGASVRSLGNNIGSIANNGCTYTLVGGAGY